VAGKLLLSSVKRKEDDGILGYGSVSRENLLEGDAFKDEKSGRQNARS